MLREDVLIEVAQVLVLLGGQRAHVRQINLPQTTRYSRCRISRKAISCLPVLIVRDLSQLLVSYLAPLRYTMNLFFTDSNSITDHKS